MVLDREFVFEVLPFDTLLTASTDTAVEFMIVVVTVRLILQDIKLGRCKRLRACRADEASFVVFAR
jgi:hypothetical protein